MSIVDSIVTLKVEKPCCASHGTYCSYEWGSPARVINCTSSAGLDGQVNFLSLYILARPHRIRIYFVLFAYFYKIALPG